MRLYIIFEDNHAELGILAHDEFLTAIMPKGEKEADSCMTVTEELISKIQQMPTMEFGFTESYKVRFIKLFNENLNKKFLMVTKFFMTESLIKKYNEVVIAMSLHDLTLEQAAKVINERYSELEPATSDV